MHTIELFFYEHAAGLDVMGPLEVFSAANALAAQPCYQITLSAPQAGFIKLSSGVRLEATCTLGQGPATDYFMVVGGPYVESLLENTELMSLIQHRARQSSQRVSVCTGAFLLAQAGLLDEKECTTHWAMAARLAERYPALKVHGDAIYIQDGDTYTSAGVTAGIDLALALVEQDYGADLALQVARHLVLYLRRPGRQSQFSTPLALQEKAGNEFIKLHHWLQENLQQPLQVERMAEFCHMSPRHFSRRFTAQFDMTPARYLEQLRLSRARELLESTSQPLTAVANAVGFTREERMRRTFLKSLGITPSVYRQHFCHL